MSEKARVSDKYAGTRSIPGPKVDSDPSGDFQEQQMRHGLALLSAELGTNNRVSASHMALRHRHQRAGGALQANAPSCYHKRKGEPGPRRGVKHESQLFTEVFDFYPRELVSPWAPDSAGLN